MVSFTLSFVTFQKHPHTHGVSPACRLSLQRVRVCSLHKVADALTHLRSFLAFDYLISYFVTWFFIWWFDWLVAYLTIIDLFVFSCACAFLDKAVAFCFLFHFHTSTTVHTLLRTLITPHQFTANSCLGSLLPQVFSLFGSIREERVSKHKIWSTLPYLEKLKLWRMSKTWTSKHNPRIVLWTSKTKFCQHLDSS